MEMPHKRNEHKRCSAQPYCVGHVLPGAGVVLGPFCCVPHLWRFFVRFAVESAYPSALQEFVISWSRLTGFPLELSAVTGFVGHFLLWRLVLGLRFYSLHGLDVYPRSELISEDQERKGFVSQRKGSGNKTQQDLTERVLPLSFHYIRQNPNGIWSVEISQSQALHNP